MLYSDYNFILYFYIKNQNKKPILNSFGNIFEMDHMFLRLNTANDPNLPLSPSNVFKCGTENSAV